MEEKRDDYSSQDNGTNLCKFGLNGNYFATSAMTSTRDINYMQTIPNGHYWFDLHQLVTYLGYTSNQWYTAWSAEVEHLIIGLENTIKNGYEIKKVSGIVNLSSHFTSVENMIKVIKAVNFSPDYKPNDFLKDFIKEIENTIDMGYNLTNGLKMERKEIYNRIDSERNYQDQNWGSRRQMDGTPDEEKPVAEWINYMEYHLAKAKERVYHLDTEGATVEIRKVTALGVRAMEIHGCPPRSGVAVVGGEKPSCDCKCKK